MQSNNQRNNNGRRVFFKKNKPIRIVVNDKLYIGKSPIHGNGIFTYKFIPKDTQLFLVADLQRYHEGGKWISQLGRLINHQKDGNTFLKKHGNLFVLYSNRDIYVGEELTSDYSVLPKPFKSDVTGYK